MSRPDSAPRRRGRPPLVEGREPTVNISIPPEIFDAYCRAASVSRQSLRAVLRATLVRYAPAVATAGKHLDPA